MVYFDWNSGLLELLKVGNANPIKIKGKLKKLKHK